MKPKIHKISHNFSYGLIGLVTSMSKHQVLWLLDNELDLSFKSAQNIVVKRKNGRFVNFPVYTCDYSRDLVYVLYTNKINRDVLIKSNKSVDYILQCSGKWDKLSVVNFIKDIKSKSNIATAFEIGLNDLKKSERSIFER